jgi:hypothetical protein
MGRWIDEWMDRWTDNVDGHRDATHIKFLIEEQKMLTMVVIIQDLESEECYFQKLKICFGNKYLHLLKLCLYAMGKI